MNSKCNFCNSSQLVEAFSLKKVPFAQNFVFETFEAATTCAFGAIKLLNCQSCGTIFNSVFDGSLIVYDDLYQNEQQHSVVFQNHLKQVISLINKKFPDKGSTINEIGCGKGYFVEALTDAGFEKVIGYDAAYEGNNPNIVKSLFGPGQGLPPSELLILRHVLEHIERPHDFLMLLAEANGYQGKIYIEVPDFTWIYENRAFWDVFHEHVNYFDQNFFLRNFDNPQIESLFGGQYIGVFLDLSTLKTFKNKNEVHSNTDAAVFEKSFERVSNAFHSFNKIYLWGASSKGVMLSNYLDPQRKKIANLIDINPRKWGKYIPGTGHKVISPDDFSKISLEEGSVVIVVNRNYKNEIKSMLAPEVNVICIEELF
jgi:hypothetical protein